MKMAKDRADKDKKKERKEKKRSEADGVSKKSKKEKKSSESLGKAVEEELTTKVLEQLDTVVEAPAADVEMTTEESKARPVGALVPFANPLADDKAAKKVLKSVKKGTYAYAPFIICACEVYFE